MYNTSTSQCFVGRTPSHQHTDSITCVKWAPDGKLYVSASLDGAVKVWDGVSSQCVATFPDAHDRAEVCSVQFTRNGKYVLSSGKDSLVKLWELSSSRCLIAYTGAGATGKQVNTLNVERLDREEVSFSRVLETETSLIVNPFFILLERFRYFQVIRNDLGALFFSTSRHVDRGNLAFAISLGP